MATLIPAVIVHVVAVASRAPAPRPSSTAPALSPVVVACAPLASWRWAYEGKIHGDLLFEKLFAVCLFDRCFGFVKGIVLDENVALHKVSPAIALGYIFS
jgi:hypothetical protein